MKLLPTLITALLMLLYADAFTLNPKRALTRLPSLREGPADEDPKDSTVKKSSLEEKMKSWEASEEEIKKASLLGVVPQKRTDAFDVGLYIAFPFMVITGLIFALFPLIMNKIDVSSVGPPPGQ